MREKTLYARLAWTGMRKNRRLYLPYLLSCAGMVLMFYILMGLSGSEVLGHMSGGTSSAIILRLGTVVIAVFALIFLFYTHSFLIRRREREFGLYNVLGMGKGNIARILLWETVITYGLTTGTGLLLGMVLYKLAELGMVRLLQVPVTYTLTVSVSSLLAAAALFAAIHTLILLNGLRQLHGVSAVGLLRSESVGEKPPKAQWVLTAAGAVLLAGAYWLAVSIREPLAALLWFFAAVIMVILATYLLFISGSVTLCRGLQRNKKYYYRPQHFVSVSSMAYRMKRNGAGLASVCILATMVLVIDLVHHLPVCGAGGRGECPVSPRPVCEGVRRQVSAGQREADTGAAGCGEHHLQLRRQCVQCGGIPDDQHQRTGGRREHPYRQLRCKCVGQHPCRTDTHPAAGGL